MKGSLIKWNWAGINLRTIFGNEPQEDETSLFYLILQHWTYRLACFKLETQNIRVEEIMYGCFSNHWLIGIMYLTLEGVILDVCTWNLVWFLSLARWFFKSFTSGLILFGCTGSLLLSSSYSEAVLCRLLIVVASLVVEYGLQGPQAW